FSGHISAQAAGGIYGGVADAGQRAEQARSVLVVGNTGRDNAAGDGADVRFGQCCRGGAAVFGGRYAVCGGFGFNSGREPGTGAGNAVVGIPGRRYPARAEVSLPCLTRQTQTARALSASGLKPGATKAALEARLGYGTLQRLHLGPFYTVGMLRVKACGFSNSLSRSGV